MYRESKRLEATQFSKLVMNSGIFGITPIHASAANKSYEQTELHQALIVSKLESKKKNIFLNKP